MGFLRTWGVQRRSGRPIRRAIKTGFPGCRKETSQGTFAKGVDTKWPETQTVAKGVASLLPRKSDEIFNFKPPPRRQETVSVPPRG